MISWCQATENPDEAAPDSSYGQSVLQVSGAPHMDDNDQHSGTCMLFAEEKFINDSIISRNTLQLKEPCSSLHDEDYVEKIKTFQFYVDMVKEIARPGCSAETLNVALGSISSLVETLSVISSKRYIQASL